VIGYIAAEAIPVGFITPTAITGSMPPGLANHVATVALFGKPSNGCLKLDRRPRAGN
jgi:cutinase